MTQGARASAVIILLELTRNIRVSVLPERDARSQGISSDNITVVDPEYPGLSITKRQDHDQVAKCGAKMVKNEVDNRELKMNSTKQPTSWP